MKRLSMRFVTQGDGIVTISVKDVRADITEGEVNSLMDLIVANDVFETKTGPITGKKDASLFDVTETEFNIA